VKILVALSGGVDSAVAAYLLKEQGHEVVGVHMALMRKRELLRTGSRGCCSIEDSNDARRVCEILGIPFYVWDLSENFQEKVIEDFLAEYKQGHTPNPCLRCNQFIKFDTLLNKALELGFDKVSTGHYAKIIDDELYRGANQEKDQSYVLSVLNRFALEHLVLPLGDFADKSEVRKIAQEQGFPVHDKPDSQDICFIQSGKTTEFLEGHFQPQEGEIIDLEGKVLGIHQGYWNYTVGKRTGLNLTVPDVSGRPRYVIRTIPATNQVVVGMKEDLSKKEVRFKDLNIITKDVGELSKSFFAQIRSHGEAIESKFINYKFVNQKEIEVLIKEATASKDNNASVQIPKDEIFAVNSTHQSFEAVAPGQTIAAYQKNSKGDQVIFSGTLVAETLGSDPSVSLDSDRSISTT